MSQNHWNLRSLNNGGKFNKIKQQRDFKKKMQMLKLIDNDNDFKLISNNFSKH